jgi:glyoxylase-like metal-dependent hydrolase (beta-lactamase superfamily II)
MRIEQVVPGIHRIHLGYVNAYLLEDGDQLALIDSGTSGSTAQILAAIESLGKTPQQVSQILLTHLHADHSGSLAELKRKTGALAGMHPIDAALIRQGQTMRPVQPAPGLLFWLMVKVLLPLRGSSSIEPSEIEAELQDNQVLDIAGGLRVIHAPGHSAGQVCFLHPAHGGVLIAADAASNFTGLGYPPLFEDLEQGIASLKKLGRLTFEVACFGHGPPIKRGAARAFRRKWG